MLHDLFNSVKLGDRSPSQLLRFMKSLLGNKKLEDTILKQLWLEKLPLGMRRIVAALDENATLEKLASVADKVAETYSNYPLCSTLVQPSTSVVQPSTSVVQPYTSDIQNENAELRETLRQLTSRMEIMSIQMNNIEARSTHRQHFRPKNRSRSRSNSGWCWFHRSFKENAHKCEPPCSYRNRSQMSNFKASQ